MIGRDEEHALSAFASFGASRSGSKQRILEKGVVMSLSSLEHDNAITEVDYLPLGEL